MIHCKSKSSLYSVSAHIVGFRWPVNAINEISWEEVSQVFHCVWGGVYVVVASLTMMAEAMSVLQPQIQTLKKNKQAMDESVKIKM